jgi:transposase
VQASSAICIQLSNNIAGTARDLGIRLSGLRKWMKADQHNGEQAFPGQGRHLSTHKDA